MKNDEGMMICECRGGGHQPSCPFQVGTRPKWTPGDWRTEAVSDAVRVVVGVGRKKIILARLAPKQLPEKETAANAKLMAAGPALVAVLKKVVTGNNCWCGPCEDLDEGGKHSVICLEARALLSDLVGIALSESS